MNLIEFFLKYNGKYLDTDGAYGNQCTDVIKAYCKEVLNIPPLAGNAIDYAKLPGFIPKGLFNTPNPGDIIVWNIGQYGHTAICNWVRWFDLGVFEQNNPIGSPCHYGQHDYKNVIGWIRPSFVFPKVPLQVACVGKNPSFNDSIKLYSSNKISIQSKFYDYQLPESISQDSAYALVNQLNPKEKFVFLFYTPKPGQAYYYYTTYYYPKKDCVITTCPGLDSRSLAFEMSHGLAIYFNEYRGSLSAVTILDYPGATGPTDQQIKDKYNLISKYYE